MQPQSKVALWPDRAYHHVYMTDTSDDPEDPGHVPPDHPDWLPVPQHWSWDTDSLICGEYVTFPLYLRLRERLCELRIPHTCHNMLIHELIDCHDDSAMDHGAARSTLVYWRGTGKLDMISVVGADEVEDTSDW